MRLIDLSHGDLGIVTLIFELHFEFLCHEKCEDLEIAFRQSLSKADTLTSVERYKAVIVAFSAIGSQRKWIAIVPSIRQEFIRSLPFVGVSRKSFNRDGQLVSLLKIVFAERQVLLAVHV